MSGGRGAHRRGGPGRAIVCSGVARCGGWNRKLSPRRSPSDQREPSIGGCDAISNRRTIRAGVAGLSPAGAGCRANDDLVRHHAAGARSTSPTTWPQPATTCPNGSCWARHHSRSIGIPRWGYYRIRALKEGFAPAERTFHRAASRKRRGRASRSRKTYRPVWCGSLRWMRRARAVGRPARHASQASGWTSTRSRIGNSRHSSTQVVIRRKSIWKEPFVKEGRTVSWREAIDGFRDATNRPGPASWQLGSLSRGR